MKTANRVLTILAISFLFVNIAMADNYLPMIKVEEKNIYLSLEISNAPVSIRILDEEGLTLIEENIAGTGEFDNVFNLESLPFGSYTLVIKSRHKEIVQPITITSGGLILDENKRMTYFPVLFSQRGAHLKLSLLNPVNTEVMVFIIDETGKVRYQDSITNQVVIEKDYNLKQLPKGNYTVIVDNEKEVYTKDLSLH